MVKNIPTVAQMQQKLSQKGYKFMFYEPMLDLELRNIISVIDPELSLAEQNINARFEDLVEIDSTKAIESFERILAGDAILIYKNEPGSTEPWISIGFQKVTVEQHEFRF